LSLYFAIGIAVVVLLAAAAAWAALPKGGFVRRNRSDAWRHLPSELQTILDEFAGSMEASQAEIRRAAKSSEAFMAAVKPIELVLRDFKTRLTEFEKYNEESEKQAAELNSSLKKCQTSLEENARAVQRIDGRLDEFSRQLAALSDELPGLKQLSQTSISQNKVTGEELRAVESDLAMAKTQMIDLSRRLGETLQARMSAVADSINSDLPAADAQVVGSSQRLDALTESVAESVAAVKALSQETAQRIAGLEPRLIWKVEELETLVNSKLAADECHSPDHADDAPAGTSSALRPLP
jgi:chromosome segregation ATPase